MMRFRVLKEGRPGKDSPFFNPYPMKTIINHEEHGFFFTSHRVFNRN